MSPPQALSDPHLRAGAKVEISSLDDGFVGSFFPGTVLRRAAANKFLVEHDDLTFDAAGTIPLRETLPAALIRPIPQPEEEEERGFEVGEEVDARRGGAWWEGVVAEELGDGRFKVFFRASREEGEFGGGELRLHREWVAGKWVVGKRVTVTRLTTPLEGEEVKKEEGSVAAKAKSTKATREKFPAGALVEVSSDEDGFQGAWFDATVVKALKKNKFLIEYKSLRNDDDTEFLREEVDSLHIRPHPPETPVVDQFKLLDEVDASYNDGWWIGAISKVLPDSRYIVYFKNTKEEIEFEHSELRLHQEWIRGKWVVTSKALN